MPWIDVSSECDQPTDVPRRRRRRLGRGADRLSFRPLRAISFYAAVHAVGALRVAGALRSAGEIRVAVHPAAVAWRAA